MPKKSQKTVRRWRMPIFRSGEKRRWDKLRQSGQMGPEVTVFATGEQGIDTYRLPAIVRANSGALLCFAEGRPGTSDDGDISIVMKRSTNGGSTWGSFQVIAGTQDTRKWGNPAPIVNRATGRIVLHMTRTGVATSSVCGTAAHNSESRRPHIIYSDDHGFTWQGLTDITTAVKPTDWRHMVGGPGHGIQIRNGPNAGRMVIAGAHSKHNGTDCDGGAHALYSDNGGTTWTLGAQATPLDGVIKPNETALVELGSNGKIHFNTRDQGGSSAGNRARTSSLDGGVTFANPFAESTLVAPTCHCSMWKLTSEADPLGRVVFCGPSNASVREDLKLRVSRDDTTTWVDGPMVKSGPAAYSDMCEHNGDLVVAYESVDKHIRFKRVPVSLLP